MLLGKWEKWLISKDERNQKFLKEREMQARASFFNLMACKRPLGDQSVTNLAVKIPGELIGNSIL